MANIASTDVSYTISKIKKMEDSRKIVNAVIAFGDGALTYPAGGVPLLKGSLGCPTVIDSLMIEDIGGSGYVYQYDKANEKIMLFQSAAVANHSHSIPPGTDAGGGVTGDAGAVAAGALSQASGVAIAAQTVKVTVIGY